MKRVTLDRAIAEMLNDTVQLVPGGPEEKCTAISLKHMQNGFAREVKTVRIPPTGAPIDPVLLANTLRGRAEMYAQDLSGVQTFQICAHYGGSAESSMNQPFRVTPTSDPNDPAHLQTEAPTEAGQTMARMRREDTVFASIMKQQNLMNEFMLRTLSFATMTAEKARKSEADMFDIMREVMIAELNAKHNKEMERLKYERETEERNRMLAGAPMLINTIAGKEVFPKSYADTALLEQIAEHITPEAALKIAAMLPQNLIGPLMARLEEYQNEKNKKAEQRQAAAAILDGIPDNLMTEGEKK